MEGRDTSIGIFFDESNMEHFTSPFEEVLAIIKSIRELNWQIERARIKPVYVRFSDSGLIYLFEILEKHDVENTLAKILSVAENEHVIPQTRATLGSFIKKEFDTHVDTILSSIVGENKGTLTSYATGENLWRDGTD